MTYLLLTPLLLLIFLGILCIWQDMRLDGLEDKVERIDRDGGERVADLEDQVESLQEQLAALSRAVSENEGEIERVHQIRRNQHAQVFEYFSQHKDIINLILDDMGKDWEKVEGYQLKDKDES